MSQVFADPLDTAAALADEMVNSSVAAITNRHRCEPSDECVDCGQPIPLARQKATGGTDHCIECQSRLER